MLNELYKVATALEAKDIQILPVHQALEPMRNAPLLVVRLADHAQPSRLEVIQGDIAETIHRVKHSSSGSSFPGVNLALPLWDISEVAGDEATGRIEELTGLLAKKDSAPHTIANATKVLYSLGKPAQFKQRQKDDFEKSVVELVSWLKDAIREAPDEVQNLKLLLDLVAVSSISLQGFTPLLAGRIVSALEDMERTHCPILVDMLLGTLDWRGRKEPFVSSQYFQKKRKYDQANEGGPRKRFVYLELANEDVSHPRVSDRRLWEAVNRHFLAVRPLPFSTKARAAKKASGPYRSNRDGRQGIDVFTGSACILAESFRGPKLVRLKSSLLFSNNTDEAQCFYRYGLGKADTFKVGEDVFLRISGGLGYLAGHDKRNREGKTWMTIPAPQSKKVCLLVAFLEDQPDQQDEYAALFGTCDAGTYDADYEARTANVLAALKGKIQGNPDLCIRLLAIAAMDEANNQIILNRSLLASEAVKSAEEWKQGASNRPEVTMIFPTSKKTRDGTGNKTELRSFTTPAPLDIVSVVNTLWASKAEGGFDPRHQRVLSVTDAYDIFLGPAPFRDARAGVALKTLLNRMQSLFARTGQLKATADYKLLDVAARWQVLKAVSLIGIFLQQQGKKHEVFMKEPIYQVGRLLALADSLHFQYCKYVRTSEEKRKAGKVDAPSELLGNALFNAALDNPVVALARLAERIRPYKGWADTYSGEDAGLVHWFVRQMAECEKLIDLSRLPKRMEDAHKAQLMLGYLADNTKSANKNGGGNP